MPTNETGLVGVIAKAIAKAYPDSWVFKVVGGPYQMSGVPDLLVCVRGLLIGLEVKYQRPGESHEHAIGRTTPGQAVQMRRINSAGGVADTVVSAHEALDLIRLGLEKWERQHGTSGN